MAAIYTPIVWHPSYCGLAGDSLSIDNGKAHCQSGERRIFRGRYKPELGCDPRKTLVPKQTWQYQQM